MVKQPCSFAAGVLTPTCSPSAQIGEYISPLLLKAKSLSSHLYLRSCAATFTQSLRLADALMAVKGRDEETVKQTRCEDVVYRMWEANMDEYLAREREWVKGEMNAIAQAWENDVSLCRRARGRRCQRCLPHLGS